MIIIIIIMMMIIIIVMIKLQFISTSDGVSRAVINSLFGVCTFVVPEKLLPYQKCSFNERNRSKIYRLGGIAVPRK